MMQKVFIHDAAIISDLHLGSDVCQAHRILGFLDSIEGQIKELILNGDVFDSWDFRRIKKHQWKVLSKIRSLSDHVHVTWVNGNHDGPAEIISHLLGVDVTKEYVLQSGENKILILHGDVFDEFITKHPIVTWFADFGYYLLQKIDPSFWMAKTAKRKSKTFLRCSELVKQRAIAYAASKGFNTVCCGHTHSEMLEEGPVTYGNSGCWVEPPGSYLLVNNGKLSLHHYKE